MTDPSETQRLFVEFEIAEGAVVRMLGLIERRGFRVRRVAMAEQPCGRRASLALAIAPMDASRDVEVLARQLERLHGVWRVTFERMLEAA